MRSLLTPVYKKIGWTLMNDHQKRLKTLIGFYVGVSCVFGDLALALNVISRKCEFKSLTDVNFF